MESSRSWPATLFVLAYLAACDTSPETTEVIMESYPDGSPKIVHLYGDQSDSTFIKKELYQPGKLKSEIPYNEGLIDGDVFVLYEDSTLAAQYHYNAGIRNGTFITWHQNGNLKSKWTFRNDTIAAGGNYFENGQLIGELTHDERGMLTYGKYFHPNGNVRSEGAWKNGNKSGIWEYFNEDGTLKQRINYDEPAQTN